MRCRSAPTVLLVSACAECHSTDLRKNYDPATDRYETTWKDVNVSCEACHGRTDCHDHRTQSAAWAEAALTP